MKQKGQVQVLILVGILVIAAVAGGAYYLGTQRGGVPLVSKASPIPSGETVDTESDRSVYTEDTRSVYTEDTRSANWKTYTNTKYSFSLKYPQNFSEESQGKESPAVLQLSDGQRSISFIIFTPKTNIQTPTNAEEITIDGQPAKKFVQSEPSLQVNVHINYGDYLYQVLMPINNETKTQDLVLFDQILSTFKFIQ